MMQPSFPGATDVPEIFSDVPEMPNLRKTGKSGSKAFTRDITSDETRANVMPKEIELGSPRLENVNAETRIL